MKQAPPHQHHQPPLNGLVACLSFGAQIKRQPPLAAPRPPPLTYPSLTAAGKLFADVKKNLYINRFCLILFLDRPSHSRSPSLSLFVSWAACG